MFINTIILLFQFLKNNIYIIIYELKTYKTVMQNINMDKFYNFI